MDIGKKNMQAIIDNVMGMTLTSVDLGVDQCLQESDIQQIVERAYFLLGGAPITPLDWKEVDSNTWRAGNYAIKKHSGTDGYADLYTVSGWHGVGTNPYDTLHLAKAAAWNNHVKYVRSLLDGTPADRCETVARFHGALSESMGFSDINPEADYVERAESDCPLCGGSGHLDDVVMSDVIENASKIKWIIVRCADTADGVLIHKEDFDFYNLSDDVEYEGTRLDDDHMALCLEDEEGTDFADPLDRCNSLQ